MRQKVIAFMLVACVAAPASVSAGGSPTLRETARKAAAGLALQSPAAPVPARNRYFWPGLVTIAGGAGIAVMAATVAKKETCGVVSIGFDVIGGCVEETNKPLMWVGIGAAAGGATLLAVGGRHHQVAVSPGSVRYRIRF